MEVHAEMALMHTRSPQAVIVRLHKEHMKAAIRGLLSGAERLKGSKVPLDVLNRAECELLEIVPVLQGQDLQEGVRFEAAHYQAAIVSMILWYKRRIYQTMAPSRITPEEMAEMKLEVFIENVDSYNRCTADLADPYKRFKRLNELEPDALSLIEQTLRKIADDIKSVDEAISQFKQDIAALDRQLNPTGWFARRPKEQVRSALLGQRINLSHELDNSVRARGLLELHRLEMAHKKGLKRLALIHYIAECKLKMLGVTPDMLITSVAE